MDVGAFVVPHAQAAELIQPGEGAFHYPAPSPKAAAVPRSTHGQSREHVAGSQTLTDDLRVIRAVAEHAVRTAPRSPSLTLEWRDRIDERQRFFRVVAAGPSPGGRPAARPARRRSRDACWLAWLDRWDSDQSSSHVPASCQSRRCRQHVIPEPQPSSCGNICHGMPLRRTKRMPVRHARSLTRGLPSFARRAGIGTNGSTRSHNASGSSGAPIGRRRGAAAARRVTRRAVSRARASAWDPTPRRPSRPAAA